MALNRSNAEKSLVENVKLEENKLSLGIDVVNHYTIYVGFTATRDLGF